MKFFPSKADPGIWPKSCYEYIAVYVDDLCIAAQNPEGILNTFKTKFYSRSKEIPNLPIILVLTTLVSQLKKYIDKLAETHKRLFNEKGTRTPLEKNDHPETDTSEILEGEIISSYLATVGQLQWLTTLGRFDIHPHIVSLSRLRAAPRRGHIERLNRVYGYVLRTKDYASRLRTEEPDYSYLPEQNYDWTCSVYGDVQEIIPDDIPDP